MPCTLSIITVVKDDPQGLASSAASVRWGIKGQAEYIVWINANSVDIAAHQQACKAIATKVLVGEDTGIFDAMNQALAQASGRLVLFLNAKDVILEPLNLAEITAPCLIPVVYTNYFGKRKQAGLRPLWMGMPYCHQGMILPRHGYRLNPHAQFSSDYEALFTAGIDWPLPMLDKGLMEYDTTGVSSRNRLQSDLEYSKIIRRHFSAAHAVVFLAYSWAKLLIKRSYDLARILRHSTSR